MHEEVSVGRQPVSEVSAGEGGATCEVEGRPALTGLEECEQIGADDPTIKRPGH
jgi:hypothetical protein